MFAIDKDIFTRKEALNSELKPYLEQCSVFPMLRHPLVFCVPYNEQENALLNRQLQVKKEHAEKALAEKRFDSYIFIHEKPYRLNAFIEIEYLLTDTKYWSLLHDIWINSENIWQNLDEWKLLLSSQRSHKHKFMSAKDRKKFAALPSMLTVYRGCKKHNKNGLSYTLDENKAIWFANRFGAGVVIKKQIQKTNIFAFTNERGENEVIIL